MLKSIEIKQKLLMYLIINNKIKVPEVPESRKK